MRFERKNKCGNRFSSTNQPTKNGRKPGLYNKISSKNGDKKLTKKAYFNTIRWIMERNMTEIDSILRYKDTPIFIQNIIQAILSDIKMGKTTTLNQLFDRLLGKPKQFQSIEVPKGIECRKEMTEEQILREFKKLHEEFEKSNQRVNT